MADKKPAEHKEEEHKGGAIHPAAPEVIAPDGHAQAPIGADALVPDLKNEPDHKHP